MIGSEQRFIWPTSNHATHQAQEWFWFWHPENSRWFCRILFPNHLKRVEGKMARLLRYVAMKSTQTYEIHRYTYILLPTSNNTKAPSPTYPSLRLPWLPVPCKPTSSFSESCFQHRDSTLSRQMDLWKNCNISMFHTPKHLQMFHSTLYIYISNFLHKKNTVCKRRLCNCQSGDPLIQ